MKKWKRKGSIMRINLRCLIVRDNKLVLCKHINKNFYFLPGGGLEECETIDQGIKRELKEELGIDSSKIIIDKDIKVIEQIFTDNDVTYHEINLIKNVYIDIDVIKSCENHIEFTEIKIDDLHNYNILPLKIKNFILDKYTL